MLIEPAGLVQRITGTEWERRFIDAHDRGKHLILKFTPERSGGLRDFPIASQASSRAITDCFNVAGVPSLFLLFAGDTLFHVKTEATLTMPAKERPLIKVHRIPAGTIL